MRKKGIDGLKGIAIIAVVLYHFGFLRYGYLGVDIFLVINGFLITKSISKNIQNGDFSYWNFWGKRIVRLCPLVFLASIICFLIGYIGMLPDDYENLCETIVASNIFSNNILSGITTKNYWDIVNEYKPLMHMWYLGILVEFYFIYPWIFMGVRKIANKFNLQYKRSIGRVLILVTCISILLFLLPVFSKGDKFYFLPFRFYELSFGGVIYLFGENITSIKRKVFQNILICILLIVLGLNVTILPSSLYVIVTVAITGILLGTLIKQESILLSISALTFIGKRSFSIYVWHQIILAFYRYFYSNEVSICMCFICLLGTVIISLCTYRYIENLFLPKIKTVIMILLFGVIVTIPAGIIYMRAGVVRDVPELNITTDNVHRNMHGEYNDRIYKYDVDFPQNEKTNILVVGNSFARDWGNVMLESDISDDINLSYSFSIDETLISRIEKSDYLFFYLYKNEVPEFVWENIKESAKVYGLGTKSFGESNGIIYSKRFKAGYFEQSIVLESSFEEDNQKRREEWGDFYIDLIEICRNDDGTIPVFSPEHKMISQDCRHLTQGGAQYFARKVNFAELIK